MRTTSHNALQMETLEDRHHRAYLGKPELVHAIHVRDSIISDHRIGQAEHLPPEGWVRQGLGVSDHAGRKHLQTRAARKSEECRHDSRVLTYPAATLPVRH